MEFESQQVTSLVQEISDNKKLQIMKWCNLIINLLKFSNKE